MPAGTSTSAAFTAVPARQAARPGRARGRSWPGRQRRQAHQDGIDIAAGLEPEQRAAVVDQVELGIAPAPFELAAPVGLVERRRHPPSHQPGEDVEERLADVAGEGEILRESRPLAGRVAFEMVVEDAADPARDAAMRNEE